ncbi:unnamed protein product [Protopolystoma xenopodis]|uniref:Uncharacterized protein n=1 Tax=Protopolystoma xenopodis TaxID=117903 RepID=A0A3S5C958_9PLAT|nr:unnamed protein product [Protopolystoma xenopodis]
MSCISALPIIVKLKHGEARHRPEDGSSRANNDSTPYKVPDSLKEPGRPISAGSTGQQLVLFNFPSRYLIAIGLVPVFSLGWTLPPSLGCIHKQPDPRVASVSTPV